MGNTRKTKNYLPDPQYQFRFLRFLILGSAIQVAAMSVLLFHFLKQNYTYLVQYTALDAKIQKVLEQEFIFLVYAIAFVFAMHVILVSVLGVLFSHKVAGAVYALKRTIKEILEGKDSELHLRRGDEFQELVDNFNEMVRQLKSENRQKRSTA